MPSEHWTFNPAWGTVIDYTGCQMGLETDSRCDYLDCKFLTTRDQAPDEPIPILRLLCPREKEIEHQGSTVCLSPDSPVV